MDRSSTEDRGRQGPRSHIVKQDMRLGIGTGSTAEAFVRLPAEKGRGWAHDHVGCRHPGADRGTLS